MEAESENLSDSASGVRISITRASWSDNEEDPNAANTREHAVMGQEELDKTLNEEEGKEQLVEDSSRSNASGADVEHDASTNAMEGDEDVSQAFNNSVSISESNAEDASKDKDDESEAFPTSPQLEVVGDRVLIERDGKFELVDVKEIKAEYFDMLGLSPPDDKSSSEQPVSEASDSVNSEVSVTRNKSPDGKTRPKTSTLDELLRRNQKKETPQKTRSKSAKTRSFSRRDEFAHLKSPYGMTEQQIEIKRKREEAIARRKKEEEERRREENRRQREDAERAFEVQSV